MTPKAFFVTEGATALRAAKAFEAATSSMVARAEIAAEMAMLPDDLGARASFLRDRLVISEA